MTISANRLQEIQNEIKTNKRLYLENCRKNYSEYVEAALILYPDVYAKIEIIEESKQLIEYNLESLQYKKIKDTNSEINILLKAVEEKTSTPYSYERLAIIYSKEKNYMAAFEICKKWLDSEYWMIPNMSGGSLRILNRFEKIKIKTNEI